MIITNAVKGNSNCEKHLDEIHVDENIEDGVRDIVIEKVFGFYRTVRNDSDDVGNFKRS